MRWKIGAILVSVVILSVSILVVNAQSVLPIATCNANQKVCDNENKIKQCRSDGSGYDLIADCGAIGKICGIESGNLTCVSPQKQPAFEMMLAIGGLLTVAYLIKRRDCLYR